MSIKTTNTQFDNRYGLTPKDMAFLNIQPTQQDRCQSVALSMSSFNGSPRVSFDKIRPSELQIQETPMTPRVNSKSKILNTDIPQSPTSLKYKGSEQKELIAKLKNENNRFAEREAQLEQKIKQLEQVETASKNGQKESPLKKIKQKISKDVGLKANRIQMKTLEDKIVELEKQIKDQKKEILTQKGIQRRNDKFIKNYKTEIQNQIKIVEQKNVAELELLEKIKQLEKVNDQRNIHQQKLAFDIKDERAKKYLIQASMEKVESVNAELKVQNRKLQYKLNELTENKDKDPKIQDLNLMYKYIEDNLSSPNDHKIDNVISFQYFLKLYKTALIWNRVQFASRKQILIAERRKALQNNNMKQFKKCNTQLTEEDEKCLQSVLKEILHKIGLSDNEFNETLNIYMADKENEGIIKEAMEDAAKEEVLESEKNGVAKKKITKNEAIKAQTILQSLQLDLMNEMAELRNLPLDQQSEQESLLQPLLLDKFFIKTGIEKDDLNQAIQDLRLEEDFDYQQILVQYRKASGFVKK